MKVCNYVLRACLDVTVNVDERMTGIQNALASYK